MEETLLLDSIFEITNTVASCWMNTFDGFWLDYHLNLSDSIKNHQLPPAVSSSLLIRLQSSWYLSWLALPETFKNRKSSLRR